MHLNQSFQDSGSAHSSVCSSDDSSERTARQAPRWDQLRSIRAETDVRSPRHLLVGLSQPPAHAFI